MPYIDKEHYFEYDFKGYALVDLREVAKRIYKHTFTIGMYDDVQPPVGAFREKYYDVDRLFKPDRKHKRLTGNFPRMYYMKQFQDTARQQKELKAFLVDTFKAWGLHLVEKYKQQPHLLGKTGFPYVWLGNLPIPHVGVLESVYKGKNMSIVLRLRGDTAQLLKVFHWECSPDGGASWFSVGKSNRPEKRVTAALEFGREYRFRVFAENPRYKSSYSNIITVTNYSRPGVSDVH